MQIPPVDSVKHFVQKELLAKKLFLCSLDSDYCHIVKQFLLLKIQVMTPKLDSIKTN